MPETRAPAMAAQTSTEMLKEVKELRRLTLFTRSELLVLTTPEGRVTYISPSVEAVLGYTVREVMEMDHISCLLGPGFREADSREPVGHRSAIRIETLDRLGRVHNLLVEIERVPLLGGRIVFTCRDTTRWQRAEDLLVRHRNLNKALGRLAELLAEERCEPGRFIRTVMVEARYLTGSTRAFIVLDGRSVPGLPEEALTSTEAFYSNSPPPPWTGKEREGGAAKGTNLLATPVHSRGKLLGRIILAGKRDGYDNEDLYTVESLARLYGVALNHHRALEKTKGMEARLNRSREMEALGMLLSGISHEINNPVHQIMLNLPLIADICRQALPVLEEYSAANPKALFGGLSYSFLRDNLPQLLDETEFSVERVAGIINELQSISRRSGLRDRGPVEINRIVQRAVKFLETARLRKQVAMELSLAEGLPVLRGGSLGLEQVVVNLGRNAIQAVAPEKGRVRIATGFDPTEKSVRIIITDDGPGIATEVAEKMFDPFITTKRDCGGTGIGLLVCRNIVKAHKGRITFQTTPGQGSEFRVILPLDGLGLAGQGPATPGPS